MVGLQDLIFSKTDFFYPVNKKRAFRNYLRIINFEIVNMPDLGWDPKIFFDLQFYSTAKQDFAVNAVIRGAQNYNIVVKSFVQRFEQPEKRLVFDDVVLA